MMIVVAVLYLMVVAVHVVAAWNMDSRRMRQVVGVSSVLGLVLGTALAISELL